MGWYAGRGIVRKLFLAGSEIEGPKAGVVDRWRVGQGWGGWAAVTQCLLGA